jgi:hypothetical protein
MLVATGCSVTTALQDIVTGPWGSKLSQYGRSSASLIDETVTDALGEPPPRFTDQDVKQFLQARIHRHDITAPAPGIDRIYTIALPQGSSAADPSRNGRHLNYDRPDGTHVYYNWILGDGTLTGPNSIPKMFSHELAETLTDADVSTGRHGITVNQQHDEIADVCNHLYTTMNGHAQQAYWSIADGRCVLPMAPQSADDGRTNRPARSPARIDRLPTGMTLQRSTSEPGPARLANEFRLASELMVSNGAETPRHKGYPSRSR